MKEKFIRGRFSFSLFPFPKNFALVIGQKFLSGTMARFTEDHTNVQNSY